MCLMAKKEVLLMKKLLKLTPERHAEVNHEKGTMEMHTEKHRHVLEAVDGELEMENIAPSCGTEVISCHAAGAVDSSRCHKTDEQYRSSFVPPLLEDSPPSPPPLPSSPMPTSPTSPTTVGVPQPNVGPLPYGETADLHFLALTSNVGYTGSQSLKKRQPLQNAGVMPSKSMLYYASRYGVCKQIYRPLVLPLVMAEAQQKAQPWRNCTLCPEIFQYVHDGGRGDCHDVRWNRGRYHLGRIERDNFPPLLQRGPYIVTRFTCHHLCATMDVHRNSHNFQAMDSFLVQGYLITLCQLLNPQ